MRYKEYLARIDDTEKRLGVLGETHIYTPDESRFAREVVPSFETIAREGGHNLYFLKLLYAVGARAYLAGTDRSFKNDTALSIAEKLEKRIIKLEEDYNFSIQSRISIAELAIVSLVCSPAIYMGSMVLGKLSKTFRRTGSLPGEHVFGNFIEYPIKVMTESESREKKIAIRSIEILRTDNHDLLILSGEGHLDRIVENLHRGLSLEEIRSFP